MSISVERPKQGQIIQNGAKHMKTIYKKYDVKIFIHLEDIKHCLVWAKHEQSPQQEWSPTRGRAPKATFKVLKYKWRSYSYFKHYMYAAFYISRLIFIVISCHKLLNICSQIFHYILHTLESIIYNLSLTLYFYHNCYAQLSYLCFVLNSMKIFKISCITNTDYTNEF